MIIRTREKDHDRTGRIENAGQPRRDRRHPGRRRPATINDKTSSGDLLLERIIDFPVERITVQELLEARVAQEVAAYNDSTDGHFQGLVQPRTSEVELNGFWISCPAR